MTKCLTLRQKTTRSSRCDELDGLKGYPDDGRQRMIVLANDYARVMLVPERNRIPENTTQMKESKYESLKDLARSRLTKREKQDYVRKVISDNRTKERELNKQIKLAEKEKVNDQKTWLLKSEHAQDKIVRDNHCKKRGEALKLEDEDVMKVFNSEIARAKCTATLQKQIEQKVLKQKMAEEEEEKLGKNMVEINEAFHQKRITEEQERKRENIKMYAELLEDQRKMKEIEKSLRKAEAEKEGINRNLITTKQNKIDIAKMKKRDEYRKSLLKQQEDMILTAQILKEKQIQEDKILDLKVEQVRMLQEEQEKKAKYDFNNRLKARDGVTDLVCAKRNEEDRARIEAEEFALQRRNNAIENKWRRNEKERIVNEIEKKRCFLKKIQEQVEDKSRCKAKEILDEIEEAKKIMNKLRELDIERENDKKNRHDQKKKMAEYFEKQAQEKIHLKQKEEEETKKSYEKMKEAELARRDILKKALDDKIQDLKSFNMNEQLIHSVQQKAENLKAKIDLGCP